MSGGILGMLKSQLIVKLPAPSQSYAGQTIIVTGSNTGLGKEAARHFARLGASNLILAVRSLEKGEAAKADIEQSTKCSKDAVKVWKLDLSSYESVIQFAERVDREVPGGRLDKAVLNAGIVPDGWNTFEDNEAVITVNVVSTFLLAYLLLPALKRTASNFNIRPNLTIVASEVHFWSKFPERNEPEGGIFNKLNEKPDKFSQPRSFERYQVSKLLEVLTVRQMAERSKGKNGSDAVVTINSVNPGLCKSELASRNSPLLLTIVTFFAHALLARTAEHGSRTLVHAASQGPETHGAYMSDCKITDPSDFVLSTEGHAVGGRVYNELMAKLEAIKPGVTQNL
ncbi:short-chain dehydrogenase [Lophiostoma macrostomum CBS 122681]|uniref:Short-chain dehydrogenase n=1 Tax=Lophiostoma macrostomum CBS 122681 TaxID=1314788 RepID=A0A6A6T4S2_9PLEO|nr:short-chain dehydrogenase [Lophiostoma macrostomum CBS 122681]